MSAEDQVISAAADASLKQLKSKPTRPDNYENNKLATAFDEVVNNRDERIVVQNETMRNALVIRTLKSLHIFNQRNRLNFRVC